MDGLRGTNRISGPGQAHERRGGQPNQQQADAFRQAMEEHGAQPEREHEPPLRRGLQPKPPIGRREDGEGLHVDVVA